MSTFPVPLSDKSRLAVLLEHFSTIDDPRDVRRITHPLAENLLLVVCARFDTGQLLEAAWSTYNRDRQRPYQEGRRK
jgi:hypothetical protein